MDHEDFVQDQCKKRTQQLLHLTKLFARKARRPSTDLTSEDFINALESMNIFNDGQHQTPVDFHFSDHKEINSNRFD